MLRRAAIIIGLLIYALSYCAMSYVPSYTFLVVVLFIMGIGGSTYHPQSTYFISRHFQKYRATASGIHGIANPVGFLLAPIVVTALNAVTGSWRSTVTLMIIPGVIAALLSRLALDEPQVKGSKGFLIGIVSGPLILLTLVSGLTMAIVVAFLSFLPFYARDAASHIPASWWLPLTLLPGIALQPLGGWIADNIGRRNLIILGLCILFVALLGFISTAGGVTLAFSMVAGGCFSLLAPVCLIYSAELAVGERVGTAVGIMWGFATGMGAISPLWVGYLRDIFPDFRLAFMSLAVLALAGAIISGFLPGQKRPSR
jgi:MFS family permease